MRLESSRGSSSSLLAGGGPGQGRPGPGRRGRAACALAAQRHNSGTAAQQRHNSSTTAAPRHRQPAAAGRGEARRGESQARFRVISNQSRLISSCVEGHGICAGLTGLVPVPSLLALWTAPLSSSLNGVQMAPRGVSSLSASFSRLREFHALVRLERRDGVREGGKPVFAAKLDRSMLLLISKSSAVDL